MSFRLQIACAVIGCLLNGLMASDPARAQNPPQSAKGKPAAAENLATATEEPPAKPQASDAAAVLEPSPLEKEILAATEKLVAAFNQGKLELLLDTFLADGELIDEAGNLYQGHEEIAAMAKAFFETYPGSRTEAQLESVRQIGDLVLADGSRLVRTKDNSSFAALKFSAVWKKTETGYKLVSLRDFSEETPLTPREALSSLEWIVGDWVNEGSDAKVSLSFRWTEDQNFILGDIVIKRGSEVVAKSSQRIAWDASQGQLRSWTFDSDGGFGESAWEQDEDQWVLQSVAVSPDGSQGQATMSITPLENSRFKIQVSNRRSGGDEEPDYEYVVVRKPPVATKK